MHKRMLLNPIPLQKIVDFSSNFFFFSFNKINTLARAARTEPSTRWILHLRERERERTDTEHGLDTEELAITFRSTS